MKSGAPGWLCLAAPSVPGTSKRVVHGCASGAASASVPIKPQFHKPARCVLSFCRRPKQHAYALVLPITVATMCMGAQSDWSGRLLKRVIKETQKSCIILAGTLGGCRLQMMLIPPLTGREFRTDRDS